MRRHPRDWPRPGGHRVVYGRGDRPTARVPVAGEWVTCDVLLKTRDPSGTWWARVAYVHPGTYDYVEELLPLDRLRPSG